MSFQGNGLRTKKGKDIRGSPAGQKGSNEGRGAHGAKKRGPLSRENLSGRLFVGDCQRVLRKNGSAPRGGRLEEKDCRRMKKPKADESTKFRPRDRKKHEVKGKTGT